MEIPAKAVEPTPENKDVRRDLHQQLFAALGREFRIEMEQLFCQLLGEYLRNRSNSIRPSSAHHRGGDTHCSRDDLVYDSAVHIGQAKLAALVAEGQTLVVDAEQV